MNVPLTFEELETLRRLDGERFGGAQGGWSKFIAKRLQCAGLLALWTVGLHESRSKLRALQTLRAVRMVANLRYAMAFASSLSRAI